MRTAAKNKLYKVIYQGDYGDLQIISQRMRFHRIGYQKSFRRIKNDRRTGRVEYRLEAHFSHINDVKKMQNFLKLYWNHEKVNKVGEWEFESHYQVPSQYLADDTLKNITDNKNEV